MHLPYIHISIPLQASLYLNYKCCFYLPISTYNTYYLVRHTQTKTTIEFYNAIDMLRFTQYASFQLLIYGICDKS